MTNQIMDVADFDRPEWKNTIAEMHDLMGIGGRNSLRHCTDRKSLLNRAEIESFKHWEYPWLIKHGKFEPGQKVLDCGCGRGFIQIYLALKLGLKVTSVDVSTMKSNFEKKFWRFADKYKLPLKENREIAIPKLAKRYGTNVSFVCSSIAKMPLKDNEFDRVYSISVLEHMDPGEDEKAMKEMSRVLKPGGICLVTVDYSPVRMERKSYDLGDVKRLIEVSGLTLQGDLEFNIPDWEQHKALLRNKFEKPNVEVSTASFILKK